MLVQFQKRTEAKDLVDLSETVIVTAANWFAPQSTWQYPCLRAHAVHQASGDGDDRPCSAVGTSHRLARVRT